MVHERGARERRKGREERDAYGGGGKPKKMLPRVSFSCLKSPHPFAQPPWHMYQPMEWRVEDHPFAF